MVMFPELLLIHACWGCWSSTLKFVSEFILKFLILVWVINFFWNGFQSPCIVNCHFCQQFCQCPAQLQLQILIWKSYYSLWSLEGMIQANKISVFHVMYLYWKVFELHIFQVLETNSTFHGKNRATPLQRHKSVCWQMVVKRKNAFWKHVKRFWPQSVTVQ